MKEALQPTLILVLWIAFWLAGTIWQLRASKSRRSNMGKWNSVCWILLGLVIAAPLAFAEEQASISRLPPLPQPLDPILQDMFDKRRAMGGAVINLTLTTGHAPKFARASGGMAFAIRFETSTPRRLIELVIFRTARLWDRTTS
jgi:hypothetical protein